MLLLWQVYTLSYNYDCSVLFIGSCLSYVISDLTIYIILPVPKYMLLIGNIHLNLFIKMFFLWFYNN